MLLIIDAGSQYTALIHTAIACQMGRQVSLVHLNEMSSAVLLEKALLDPLRGVVISGGPQSTAEAQPELPQWLSQLLATGVPVLGICFGFQWLAASLGGAVQTMSGGEYGKAELRLENNPTEGQSVLLAGFPLRSNVWMSHMDGVVRLPPGFVCHGSTDKCPLAVAEDAARRVFCAQFHPEVQHTDFGQKMLYNFVEYCDEVFLKERSAEPNVLPEPKRLLEQKNSQTEIGAETDRFDYGRLAQRLETEICNTVGTEAVLLALSGGVDSAVLCRLLARALPGRVHCVFVDNGLLRTGEVEEVCSRFSTLPGVQFHLAQEAPRFFAALTGLADPELKRKAVGRAFVDTFESLAPALRPEPRFFAQGTIWPDVVESSCAGGSAELIKSHHNVGGLPARLRLQLLEPFRSLFKHQVRRLGAHLGENAAQLERQPFPGPGLAIRVVGEVAPDDVRVARRADDVFQELLRRDGLLKSTAQAFAALLPVRTVGVVGDQRRYGRCVVLRAVASQDFMTAAPVNFAPGFLEEVASAIIGRVEEVSRVFYDFTSKPPGTIEME